MISDGNKITEIKITLFSININVFNAERFHD